MSDAVTIEQTVGGPGAENPRDVAKVWAALAQIGPDRGGVSAIPLSSPDKQLMRQYLLSAIRSFQNFYSLPATGRIDRNDLTLRRINEVLNPGAVPAAAASARSGALRPLALRETMVDSVRMNTPTPNLNSFKSDWVFSWEGCFGSGKIYYFELDEDVVPNWFGVLVPDGLSSFEHVHLFFHPTSGAKQGGHLDENYKAKRNWSSLFHYLSDRMAAQFCAAKSGQVLVMPLMTLGVTQSAGILPARWESLIGQMLARIARNNLTDPTTPAVISSLVVSSFSSGIIYSASFRRAAKLGSKLRAIIDFDGIISTNHHYSETAGASAFKFWQSDAPSTELQHLIARRQLPLPASRWGTPWRPPAAPMMWLHGLIPQTMMLVAADLTRAR